MTRAWLLLAPLLLPITGVAASDGMPSGVTPAPQRQAPPPVPHAAAPVFRVLAPVPRVTPATNAGSATPSGFTPAPMPNIDIAAPPAANHTIGPEVSATLSQPRDSVDSGNGFTPGSQYSTDLERRARLGTGIAPGFAPTVNLKFPLDWSRR